MSTPQFRTWLQHSIWFKSWWVEQVERPAMFRDKRQSAINFRMEQYRRSSAYIREYLMSKKETKSKPVKYVGYVNISISSDHEPDIIKYLKDDKQVWVDMAVIVESLYRIEFAYDPDTDGFKCTLKCYDPESPNAGYFLSGYGNSWYDALGVVLFKHNKIADGDWDSYKSSEKRRFG